MQISRGTLWVWALGLSLLGVVNVAHAAKTKSAPVPQPDPSPTSPDESSSDESKLTPLAGPGKFDLGHELEIDLPEGYLYLDAVQAAKLMERMGNLHNEDLLAVLAQPESSWIVTVRYTEEGYVKDDEAEEMDHDEILNAIREGTDAANKERASKGFKAIHVMGWSEAPRYARDRHQLVWGIRGKSDGAVDEVVNYNTRVLGRNGYASLNLIDEASKIDAAKPAVASLLAATHYKAGARYQDFDSKKDKVAEYGLAALVAGGAGAAALKLVKVGLLAKFAGKIVLLLVALKKGIFLVILAALALLKRLFRRKTVVVAPLAEAPTFPEPPPASAVQQHPAEDHSRGEDPA